MAELGDVLNDRNSLSRGSGNPPLAAGGSGGGSSSGTAPTPREEDMTLIAINDATPLGATKDDEGAYSDFKTYPSAVNRIIATRNGTLRRFVFRTLVANDLNGPMVVSVLKDGIPTALTLTFAGGEVALKTIDIPVAISANEGMSFRMDRTGATTGTTSGIGSFEYIPNPS